LTPNEGIYGVNNGRGKEAKRPGRSFSDDFKTAVRLVVDEGKPWLKWPGTRNAWALNDAFLLRVAACQGNINSTIQLPPN
jgi:hypothetical protein